MRAVAKVNSWDLTGDKVSRYVAPFAFVPLSALIGVHGCLALCVVVQAVVALCKRGLATRVAAADARPANRPPDSRPLLRRVAEGWALVSRSRAALLCAAHTFVTNAVAYPAHTTLLPVALRDAAARRDPAGDGAAWAAHNSFVSLGGAIAPLACPAVVAALSAWRPSAAIAAAAAAQAVSFALFAACIFFRHELGAALPAAALVAWGTCIASNGVFTILFDSFSQVHYGAGERGRFVASILASFAAAQALGTTGYASALGDGGDEGFAAVGAVLLCGVLLRAASAAFITHDPAAGAELDAAASPRGGAARPKAE
eukprot:TRINITY_DN29581_c0_g1_i1.p1 TRINITY_DN29581_c0_g1~~TRINITY_DN29581_c0_g1_i1.p1  ORF type:complete len:315 (+),score=63.74 TRINITY_DN29581_c0_g1_i1:133-1077(+)